MTGVRFRIAACITAEPRIGVKLRRHVRERKGAGHKVAAREIETTDAKPHRWRAA
jgi:hypothetical protein